MQKTNTTEPGFDAYWQKHRMHLLQQDESYRKATGGYKMTSGADYLLFGIPIAAGIVSIDYLPLQSEMFKWACSAAITIVCFALCVWVKTAITAQESLDDIERRVKRAAREAWEKEKRDT